MKAEFTSMKKILLVLLLFPLLAVGCWKKTPSDVNTTANDEFKIEKDVYITDARTEILYGIHINASDVLLTLADLPKESTYEEGLKLDSKRFVTAVLSPSDKNLMAFSVQGETTAWSGLYNLESKEIRQFNILKKGMEAGEIYWAPDGRAVVLEDIALSPNPHRFLTLVGITDRSTFSYIADGVYEDDTYTGAKDAVLDLYDPVWNGDSESFFFTVRILPDGEADITWLAGSNGDVFKDEGGTVQ